MIDHYENPRNVGSMDKNDKNVGTGLVGAPACGDVMKLQVRSLINIYVKLYQLNFIKPTCKVWPCEKRNSFLILHIRNRSITNE